MCKVHPTSHCDPLLICKLFTCPSSRSFSPPCSSPPSCCGSARISPPPKSACSIVRAACTPAAMPTSAARSASCSGPPLVAGNKHHAAGQRRADLSGDAQRDPHRADQHHVRDLRLPRRRSAPRSSMNCRLLRAAACRCTCCSTGWARAPWNRHLLAAARAAGCDLQIYHPPSWYHLGRLNNRTHRKLHGRRRQDRIHRRRGHGHRVARRLNGLPPWRETHFKAEGPVVAQMQAVFIDNWIKATGRVLHGAEYFPKLSATCGDMEAQMFGSSPVGGSESMHLMVLLALTAAKTSIDIAERLLRAGQAHRGSAVLRGAARRARAHRRARPPYRRAHRPLGGAGVVWRTAEGRHPDLRIPADDDALQGAGHRRRVELGGLGEFRRPFVPPERRGQSQCVQRRAGARADPAHRRRHSAVAAAWCCTSGATGSSAGAINERLALLLRSQL